MFNNYAMGLCELSNSIKPSDVILSSDIPIYHYTSPNGFKGIIENGTLRFTDRYFLNDFSEGVYVLDLCIENINSLLPSDDEFRKRLLDNCNERKEQPQINNFYVYQCSFSTNGDSLCLWNYYTKGDNIQGYNLCFSSKDLCDKLKLTAALKDKRLPTIWGGKVVYDKAGQLKIVKNLIDKFLEFSKKYNHKNCCLTTQYLVDKLMFIGIFFKRECFKIEDEYRFAIDLYRDPSSGEFVAIKETQRYYEKNGILIPFVDVIFDTNALQQIGMSPTLDFKVTAESIYRTTIKNFPQIKVNSAVKKSDIPVRY